MIEFTCPHCGWGFISLETTGVTTTRLLLSVSEDGRMLWAAHVLTKEPDGFDVRRTFQCSRCYFVLDVNSEEDLIEYLKEQQSETT